MSRDIRSFFSVISKKPGTDSVKPATPVSKKKAKRIIDSDDEDVISSTPETKAPKHVDKKQKTLSSDSGNDVKTSKHFDKGKATVKSSTQKPAKIEVLSSDSEDEIVTKKINKEPEKKESELKPVSINDVFKNTPIKQSKVEPLKTPVVNKEEVKKGRKKNGRDAEKKVHDDAAFKKTLEDLDDDFFEQHFEELEMSATEALQKEEHTKHENKLEKSTVQDKNDKKDESENQTGRKRSRTESTERSTPKKKKIEHVDSGIDPGQEAHEKKRYSAMLYQKYLNRSGPKHHGLKELPKGKPNCLNNLCFLKTGVLDSMESEEFEKLIKEHGGRVVHGISKKVNYVVVGEDPGPAKLAKAESYKIPTISEDELLDMILKKSGMEPKYCKKNNSGSSDDLGIEVDHESTKEDKTNTPEKQKTPNETIKVVPKKSPEEQKQKDKTLKMPKEVPDQTSSIKSSSFYSQPSETTKSQPANCSTTQDLKQIDTSMLSLTEKYKPTTLKAVIGQQGEKSNLYKLKHWLEKWHKNQDPKVKKSLVRPSPWAKSDDGAYFKCALLSGPPGVGKTTSATLVAKELGLDIVEFNASDTRSKKSLQEQVAQLLHTKTIAGFATGQTKMTNNRVLLMDEVDGMAGNEDRGGIQELIQLIKNSSIPIICMCNDRNHQKMRSLVNYCFDLRFPKPRLEQIRGAMMSVCFKEKIDVSAQALSEIIAGTGCDIRQTLNHLAILGSTKEKITSEIAEKESKASKKDTIMGPWEVCRTVFTKSEHKDMSIVDRARLFFFDYSLGPLFVQENYLRVQPEGANQKQTLLKAALTASSLSTADIIDAKIRKNNNWALLESQAFYASVLPGHYMSGHFTGQINFPSWLGKNSKKTKFKRLLSELQMHTRVSASASKMAIKLDYLVPLRNAIISPLKKKGMDGVDEAVSVMKEYNLLREDVDSLVELYSWATKENPMSSIETKVKSAFTRAYNKNVTLLPYAPISGVAKKKAAAAETEVLGEEEEEVVSDHEDDDISNNVMIKVKKKAAGKGKKTDDEPGTSKKKETKRGGKGKKMK